MTRPCVEMLEDRLTPSGVDINGGLSWNGWKSEGASNQLGVYGSGSTSAVYEIYSTQFSFDNTTNTITGSPTQAGVPTPSGFDAGSHSTGAFANGDRIYGLGVRAISGGSISGFWPTVKFDLDNDSFKAASSVGSGDGHTSFSKYSQTGDFTVQFEGTSSWRPSSINVQTGDGTSYGGTDSTVQLPGGIGSGTSYDFAFRAFAQVSNNSYQMFFDLDAMQALYGTDAGNIFPGAAGIGTIGENLTICLNGLGDNQVVIGGPAPTADLQLTNSDGSATYTPGGSTTYTITVTNAGPDGVMGATVADTFPAAFTSVTKTASVTGGAVIVASNGGSNINDTVDMPAGSTITYLVTGTIASTATGNLTNTASVLAPSGTADPTGNNTAIDTDTPAGVIAGTVWQDFKGQGNGNEPTNGDGIREPGEKGYAGDLVTLLDQFSNVVAQTTSAASGAYQFVNVAFGTYSIQFSLPSGLDFTLQNQSSDPTKKSAVDPLTGIAPVTLDAPVSQFIGAGLAACDDSKLNPLLVTTNLDVVDPKDCKISLREAVATANSKEVGLQRITFDMAKVGDLPITLDPKLMQMDLKTNIFIDGPVDNIIIQRDSESEVQHRIFRVGEKATVTLSHLYMYNGMGAEWGGGILSRGNLTLNNCRVSECGGEMTFKGGGIAALRGSLTLTSTRIDRNSATGQGAASSSANESRPT